MTGPMERFTVTAEHLALAKRMGTRWDDVEFGAPAVDSKRPYGNGDVYRDMREILGRPPVDEDHWGQGADEAGLLRLHREMETVLQIALRTGAFEEGEYVARRYFSDWQRA